MSDWGGTHSTVAAALAGLDQEMPDDEFFGPALLEAVQNGTVPESVLDDKVLRILTGMYAAGLFDRPVTGNIANNVTSDEHNALARSFAANAMVLLANNGILPIPPFVKQFAVRDGVGGGCVLSNVMVWELVLVLSSVIVWEVVLFRHRVFSIVLDWV